MRLTVYGVIPSLVTNTFKAAIQHCRTSTIAAGLYPPGPTYENDFARTFP
jgi:hypothetical protein